MPGDASDADVVKGEARHVDESPRLAEPLLLLALTCGAASDLVGLVGHPLSEEYSQVREGLEGKSLADMPPQGLRSLDIPEAYLKHLRSYAERAQRAQALPDEGARDLRRVRVLLSSGLCELGSISSHLGVSKPDLERLLSLPRPGTASEVELAARMRKAAYSSLRSEAISKVACSGAGEREEETK